MPLPKANQQYTYADYITWKTEDKYELFDGVPVMQARPFAAHQQAQVAIASEIYQFLKEKPCRVFTELEVLLPEHNAQSADEIKTVYVPDIIVVCEPDKIKEQYCLGAPTVAIEILSPSTAKNDRVLKLNRYQAAGVKEYWIVSPQERTVHVFTLQDGFYRLAGAYTETDTAAVVSLPGCLIDLHNVFHG